MNHGRQDRSLKLLPTVEEVEASQPDPETTSAASEGSSPLARWTRPGRSSSAEREGVIEVYRMPHPRWMRPRRPLERRQIRRAEQVAGISFPRLPEGIPDEEGTSLGALASVLVAYHRTVPKAMRDEYVRQLMKFAGEKAGQLLRTHLDAKA